MKFRSNQRRILPGASATALFLALISSSLFVVPSASASAAYSATDEVGFSTSTDGPDFTHGTFPGYTLSRPQGSIISTGLHDLFVSDSGNDRIQVYQLDSSNHLTNRQPLYTFGTVAATSGNNVDTVSSPLGLSFNETTKQLFVADSGNNRVLVYNLSGGISDSLLPSQVFGQANLTTTASSATATGLSAPSGVYYDASSSRLFVADSGNNRVLSYDLSSGITNGMAANHELGQTGFGTATSSASATTMHTPLGISYDSTRHYLFVADSQNSRVLIFNITSGVTNGMAASYELGQTTFSGVSQSPGAANLSIANDVIYDQTNHRLFVTDLQNSRVAVYNLTNTPSSGMAASYAIGQADLNSSAQNNENQQDFRAPGSVTYDSTSQQLFVSDYNFDRVMVFDLSSGITNTMNASDSIGHLTPMGSPDYTDAYQDEGAVAYPEGSALDPINHRLYVAGCNGVVPMYQLNNQDQLTSHNATALLGVPGSQSITNASVPCATAVSYDSARQLLFVDEGYSNRILVFNLSNGMTTGMAASYVLGQPDFGSSNPNEGGSAPSNNTLSGNAGGMAYDPATHNLYVGDSSNARVLVFNTATLSTNMAASYVLGQPNFTTVNSSLISQSSLASPTGLALNTVTKQLFVADSATANRVLVFNTASLANGMPASNVLGETSFTQANSAADSGNIDDASFKPIGLSVNIANDQLAVEDTNADRVLLFNLYNGITNGMPATAVIGQPDMTTGTACSTTDQYTFCGLYGTTDAFDPGTNRLYVSDAYNSRLMLYDLPQLTPLQPGTVGIGSTIHLQQQSVNVKGTASYAVTGGSLPPGLTLDPSTGLIAGTTTTPGTYTFTVQLSDTYAQQGAFTDDLTYTMQVSTPIQTITPTATLTSSITSVTKGDTVIATPGNDVSPSSPAAVYFAPTQAHSALRPSNGRIIHGKPTHWYAYWWILLVFLFFWFLLAWRRRRKRDDEDQR